jgi:predicted Zn finger-like uncharacterized protein
MRLACPNCQATYDIPDALLGAGGRRLRCARCAADWVADPAAALDAPAASVVPPPVSPVAVGSLAERAMDAAAPAPGPSPAKPDPATVKNDPIPSIPGPSIPGATRASLVAGSRGEARPIAARPPVRRPGVAVVAFAWVLSFAILGGAAAAAYVWRADVMAAWPQSQRLYAALGLR